MRRTGLCPFFAETSRKNYNRFGKFVRPRKTLEKFRCILWAFEINTDELYFFLFNYYLKDIFDSEHRVAHRKNI